MALDSNRQLIRDRLREIFIQYNFWLIKSDEEKDKIISQIEKSCYNAAYHEAKDKNLYLSWSESGFVFIYSSICNEILAALNKNGVVNSDYLAKKICNDEIDTRKICEMTTNELCPENNQKELDFISLRNNQKIDVKYTTTEQCPKCKSRKSAPRQVQKNSADELSSFNFKCLICNYTWFGGK